MERGSQRVKKTFLDTFLPPSAALMTGLRNGGGGSGGFAGEGGGFTIKRG